MNNRRIIKYVIIGVVIIVGLFGLNEFLSYKDVSFQLKNPDITIKVYSDDGDREVATISEDTELRLKSGQYFYRATIPKYDSSSEYFTIDENKIVEVNPAYSQEQLSRLLSTEIVAIRSILSSKYPIIESEYVIGDEELLQYGEWYVAKIIQRVSGGNQPDVYRVVLHKENDTWSIIAAPQLIISKVTNLKVPNSVIARVNAPLSNEAYALLYPE